MSAGSFVGAIAAGFISDKLGRRGALKVASCIWVVGAAVQCSSQNVTQLIIGRIISGLASQLEHPSHINLSIDLPMQLVSHPRKSVSTWLNSHLDGFEAVLSVFSSGPLNGAFSSCT